jgi:hypothetical protein
MAIKTYAEQLEEVQTAISAIESGAQEYQIGGKRVRKGDLAALYKREEYLRSMVNEDAYGSEAIAGWGS